MGNNANSSCAKSVRIHKLVILKGKKNIFSFFHFSFEPIEKYLEIISHVTTARFMHIYFFPLFLVFGVKKYVNVMIAAISSHISIILLKW